MVVLDDNILSSIRQQLLRIGYTEEDVKPASLIQSVLTLAREGALRPTGGASISKCMRSDLSAGLDDPFDERASSSCEEMAKWEQSGSSGDAKKADTDGKELPLVIFLRTEASKSLLKSKSAVDALLSECNSKDSINFLILGKGIDATTDTLPAETESQVQQRDMSPHHQQPMHSQTLPGAAPWFGFTPHNQNASGRNDPEGSRRFNIFLARTLDPNGTPGIVGAVAPPEAGNLFPHMIAMQARMQLQQQDEDSPAKAELERWAQMLQQQMQTDGGMPLPPPQFFNASLTMSPENSEDGKQNTPQLSPELIQETLEHALSELLDRLAQLNEEGAPSPEMSPDMQKAFAHVLRNESLRRGIAENLARAAPALSDPKCQGVLLSVFVPPPPHHMNHGKLPGPGKNMPNNMGGWFQKMLNNQEESDMGKEPTEENRRKSRQKRVRTMAAAAAVKAAHPKDDQRPAWGVDHLLGEDDESHHHGQPDPHIWLAPPLVKIQARHILTALCQIDPKHTSAYQANYDKFIQMLDQLDFELRNLFKNHQGLAFMVFHPSWGYFAQAYGLKQLSVEMEGKDPKPAQMQALIQFAQAHAIRIIFVQPQFSSRSANAIAKAINGELVIADPLAYNWSGNLHRQALQIKAALR